VKCKRSRLAEVQIQSASYAPASGRAGGAAAHAFTVGLPQGASVLVPTGFDPDELMSLLIVVQEALS